MLTILYSSCPGWILETLVNILQNPQLNADPFIFFRYSIHGFTLNVSDYSFVNWENIWRMLSNSVFATQEKRSTLLLNKLRVKCSRKSFRTFVHCMWITQINDEFNLTVQHIWVKASVPDNSLQFASWKWNIQFH